MAQPTLPERSSDWNCLLGETLTRPRIFWTAPRGASSSPVDLRNQPLVAGEGYGGEPMEGKILRKGKAGG